MMREFPASGHVVTRLLTSEDAGVEHAQRQARLNVDEAPSFASIPSLKCPPVLAFS
jgi:hypothetical protein